MERFTLELELGNDGMMTAGDVRQALENAGTRLVGLVGRETVLEELLEAGDAPAGRMLDVNGNTCGRWAVES